MATREDLNKKTAAALKKMAKAKKIKGYGKMKKAELVAALAAPAGKGSSTRARISSLLKDNTRESLYELAQAVAKKKGLTGYSTLDKRGLASFVAKAEAGKLKPKATEASVRRKMKEKKGPAVRYGKGAFRIVLVEDNSVYGELGPYATVRSAIVDGKRLLRMMVGEDYKLSQAKGDEEYKGEKLGGGVGVAGIVPIPKGDDVPELPTTGVAIAKVTGAAIKQADIVPPILRNRGRRRNSRGSSADAVSARELALFIENDGTLYRSQTTSIITNLAKKMAKGQFDRAKAVKLMGYLADNGARKYGWEFVGPRRGNWHSYSLRSTPFTAADRRAAAAILLDSYMEAIEGEAASMGGSRRNSRGRRRNPRVSFMTKDGPVSFMAKSKSRK